MHLTFKFKHEHDIVLRKVFHLKVVHMKLNGVSTFSSEVIDDSLALFLLPEGEVFLKELNDGLGITEGLFVDVIDLLEGLRKSLLSKLASLLVVVHNLIVEDREVESETESDGVACVKALGKSSSGLITSESTVLHSFELVALGRLSNISVIVTDHLLEECLRLVILGEAKALILNNVDDLDALVVQFIFDLLLVGLQRIAKLGVLGVLLDGTNGADSASLRANQVLEADRQQVALIDSEVLTALGANGFLQEVDHILESLGLLSNTRKEDVFFN